MPGLKPGGGMPGGPMPGGPIPGGPMPGGPMPGGPACMQRAGACNSVESCSCVESFSCRRTAKLVVESESGSKNHQDISLLQQQGSRSKPAARTLTSSYKP